MLPGSKAIIIIIPGLPMTHSLLIFDALKPNFTLFVCIVRGIDPLNFRVRGVFTLENFVLCVRLKKVGTAPPLSDTGTTHVTLAAVPCCQLNCIPYIFKHCEFLVLKIRIQREATCITLHSQKPNTPFKI